ncbi:hypothetical protein SAMN05720606_11540 [Paenibacillus polysaccharolyticus]|uniref:Uncharacterized protein n=1 Tax=Paenibacillus polysaccharolyticus TaxID=582692 RepID=A0A1G5KHP2_9BACL|nr:hypothetical protein [Paenibacillus polysaccharolyticus]SCY99914.1 hypothetical protein SAMN05720606_11540 [Paenibacillus polysaccharolyticus]
MYKKLNLIIFIILIVILSSCSVSKTTTDALVSVISKSSSNSTYWIEVKNIESEDSENFKLYLDDENLWNVIEEGKNYVVTYTHKSDKNEGDISVIRNPK